MATRERTFIGLYSGPGADGATAAVVQLTGRGARMKAREAAVVHRRLPESLRKRVLAASTGWAAPPKGLAGLDRDFGEFLAGVCRTAMGEKGLAPREVAAVGLQGPVVGYAAPEPPRALGAAAEIGSPTVVAARAGVPVVSGFVQSDLAVWGVGGPVTAWPNWQALRDKRLSRVVVHLGAIASLAFVGSDAAVCEVVAYDVGPGTVLIDQLTRRLFEREMDEDGLIAARGRSHEAFVHELAAGAYFQRQPPKLTFPADWAGAAVGRLEQMAVRHGCGREDVVASVTELTARVVAGAVSALTERPHEVILSGGGARNITLARRIRALLSPCSTYVVERYGLSLRGHAPTCYAMLAAARLDGLAAHCPAATGADRTVVLGAVTLP